MGCDVLLSSMESIQKDYLKLLKKYEHFDVDEVFSIQNECQTFWLRHKRSIDFFLNNYPCDFDTCVFIGGMYLNIASKSLFPFLTFGKKHISDDPVAMITATGSKDYLAEYLKMSIADNIDIIQNHSGQVFILPLSFLFVDKELCEVGAKNSFWHLFELAEMNEKKYFENFASVDEVIKCIGEENGWPLFLKYDKPTLKERYLEHLNLIGFPIQEGRESVVQFYNICMGLFIQAITVINFCSQYWMFPFLRDDSLFGCYYLFLKNMLNRDEFAGLHPILNKAVILKQFYRLFVYEELDDLGAYLKMLKETAFEENVQEKMNNQGVGCDKSGSFAKVNTILIEEMQKRKMPCVVDF